MAQSAYTLNFSEIGIRDIGLVGGKNASLGEMFNSLSPLGIPVPDGFAVTAAGYLRFLGHNKLTEKISELIGLLDTEKLTNLAETGKACRKLLMESEFPTDLKDAITNAYRDFTQNKSSDTSLAVRSSATAEDLPDASFAGQHDSFLNIRGEADLIRHIKLCYVSLFNDRAIKYRCDHGFDHLKVYLSAGVQEMVRSDEGSAGVAFTLDPESGFRDVVYITGSWGLGENIVQGAVSPDEWMVFKNTLKLGHDAIIRKRTGRKEKTMVFSSANTTGSGTLNTETPEEKAGILVLSDKEVNSLARWCCAIEEHYGKPMDIEWAKDGLTGKMYIVQARPETVRSRSAQTSTTVYDLKTKLKPVCSGKAVGKKIVTGTARLVKSIDDADKVLQGDIIVADITNPDWNVMLKRAVSIITNKGGRTSHASIVARELGIPAVVGTGNATDVIRNGQQITVSCAAAETGYVYEGLLDFTHQELDFGSVPQTATGAMFILANPERAFDLSFYPNNGVGLLRMEFIITGSIGIHPMALAHFDSLPEGPEKQLISKTTAAYPKKEEYFIEKLSLAVAQVAAAFYPKDVIVRMSDFKSNEYYSLEGGSFFEENEENPMIGFRGASRYYHNNYKDGFRLECEAMMRVRNKMGFTNVKLMIPFCRTPEEGKKVTDLMGEFGLKRGENGLQIYTMIEIPSNVICAEDFAKVFDGFSIGSNDLTQLTLGIDRDSQIISSLFNERDPAALWMIRTAIQKAKQSGTPIGLCGQAPSDYPEFAAMLVEEGIDSISFTPDSILNGIQNIYNAEKSKKIIS